MCALGRGSARSGAERDRPASQRPDPLRGALLETYHWRVTLGRIAARTRGGEGFMKLIVADEITAAFPELRIAVLVARDIDNRGADPGLQELKRTAAKRLSAEFTYDDLNKIAEIEAWRQAYRSFGVKPKDSRPTAEAFLRRLIKGDDFPTISKAVDAYLLTETEYYLPVGGYDLATISGNIRLRFSDGDESFTGIGGMSEVTRPGEVVYSDSARVLTRKWNYRDCDHCKITEGSSEVALFTEAPFGTIATEKLERSVHRMAGLVENYCGGAAQTMLLDVSATREISLDLETWPRPVGDQASNLPRPAVKPRRAVRARRPGAGPNDRPLWAASKVPDQANREKPATA